LFLLVTTDVSGGVGLQDKHSPFLGMTITAKGNMRNNFNFILFCTYIKNYNINIKKYKCITIKGENGI